MQRFDYLPKPVRSSNVLVYMSTYGDDAADNVAARFDLIEQRQADLHTKFDIITTQLQLLLAASHGSPVLQN